MIKALIFDLDNTLIDRQKAFKEMLQRRFDEFVDDKELKENMISDILLWDNNGMVERLEVFKRWADKYNITFITPEQLDSDWSKESGSIAFLYEDVRETLTKLKEKYKIAVLSNGNKASQRRKMATIDIYDLLDYSLVSGEFHVRKPDPEIYKYTCLQLGLEPEECVYVGDNYRIDVLGSMNAGLKPIYVQRTDETHTDVQTIHEIKELLDLF